MAQTNFTPILTYKSDTAAAVPSAGNLTNSANGAELAVNTADKRLFTKDSGGSVVELGTNPSSVTLPNGTANGVVYANGSKVLTTGSALTFDGTNFGVGIAPVSGYKAAINGDIWQGNTGGIIIGSLINNGGWYEIAGSANVNGLQFAHTATQRWMLSGSEQMRLTSTGLGIGTSSPGQRLEVANTGGSVAATLRSSNSGYSELYFARVNDNAASALSYEHSTSLLRFYNGGSVRATIDSSGNLGLGVTPSAWTSTHKAYQLQGGGSLYNNGADGYLNLANNFYYDGADWRRVTAAPASLYLQSSSGHLWGYVGTGAANSVCGFPSAQMALDSSGNLGLGVTPSAWSLSGLSALQVKNGSLYGFQNEFGASANAYFNSGWKYIATAAATQYVQVSGAHQFFTAPSGTAGNAISFTQAMTLDASGNLLVGTTTPTATTPGIAISGINGSATNVPFIQCSAAESTNAYASYVLYSTTASAYRFYVGMGGTVYATSTTISAISDQRLKENIQDLDAGLDKIMALKPRKFDWKAGKGKDIKGDRGWIAQEFEQVFPDMIDTWKDESPEGEEPYKSVRADLIPVLVKAIQEQQAIITALTARVAALESN